MTKLFTLLFVVLSTTANAEIRDEITGLDSVAYDGDKVTFSYTVGGGFEEHEAKATIAVTEKRYEKQTNFYFVKVQLRVFDVIDNPDPARGLVTVKGEASISEIVKEKLKSDGLTGNVIVESVTLLPVEGPKNLVQVK